MLRRRSPTTTVPPARSREQPHAVRYRVPRPQDQLSCCEGAPPQQQFLRRAPANSLTRSGTECRDRRIDCRAAKALPHNNSSSGALPRTASRGQVPSAATAGSIVVLRRRSPTTTVPPARSREQPHAVRYRVPRPQDQLSCCEGAPPQQQFLRRAPANSLTRSGTECRDRRIDCRAAKALPHNNSSSGALPRTASRGQVPRCEELNAEGAWPGGC